MLFLLWLSAWLSLYQNAASRETSSLFAISKDSNEILHAMAERLEMVEEKLDRLEMYTENIEKTLQDERATNTAKVMEFEDKIKTLEKQLLKKSRNERKLENAYTTLTRRMNHHQEMINSIREDLDQFDAEDVEGNRHTDILSGNVNGTETSASKQWVGQTKPTVRRAGIRKARQTSTHIAFSTYLTSRLTGLGVDHILQFTGITLNEGSAYNRYTGIFTAPVSGVYLFSCFIENYVTHNLRVKLVVDGSTKSSAVAFPYTSNRYVQGGNVVFLRLIAGNSVWVAIDDSNDSIDGSANYKVTTFSGVYLYP